MSIPIFLFDVDGVLVQPGGYRAAVRSTVNHFANRMGLGDCAPDDATIAIFEAQGITCEWDMIPLLLAILLEELSASQPGLPLDTLDEVIDDLHRRCSQLPEIDFASALRRLNGFATPGVAPSDAILLAVEGGACDLFPRLARRGVLRDLLSNTRRPAHSPTTALFEAFALGDEVYSRAMGLPALVRSPSLLSTHDRPLLRADLVHHLNQLCAGDRLRMAAYTARPSLPLEDNLERLAVYAPEAELALRLVGLERIALVGSGQTGEVARRLGEQEDRLTKPAPYHALLAAAAALTGDRRAAARWTQALFEYIERGAPLPEMQIGSMALPRELHLHVFEDSPTGMSGAQAAAHLLEELGLRVSLGCWGVSAHPEKQAALRAAGALVFPKVNAALEHVLREAL